MMDYETGKWIERLDMKLDHIIELLTPSEEGPEPKTIANK